MSIADSLTWLFVPGDRDDRFPKAAAAGADVVVLDLQDAVAPPNKHSARATVIDWLSGGGAGCVRINPVDTPTGRADIDALAGWASEAREISPLRAVMVPLAESPVHVEAVAAALPGVSVVPLVESARGILGLRELCAHPATTRIAFGNLDTAADIGCPPTSPTIQRARIDVVLSARAAGLPAPIDGVTPGFADLTATAEDAAQARDLGFGGKLCIHPAQLAPVVNAFKPTADEIRWADRVEAAIGAGGPGVVSLDGAMLDAPLLRRARGILGRAAREDGL